MTTPSSPFPPRQALGRGHAHDGYGDAKTCLSSLVPCFSACGSRGEGAQSLIPLLHPSTFPAVVDLALGFIISSYPFSARSPALVSLSHSSLIIIMTCQSLHFFLPFPAAAESERGVHLCGSFLRVGLPSARTRTRTHFANHSFFFCSPHACGVAFRATRQSRASGLRCLRFVALLFCLVSAADHRA